MKDVDYAPPMHPKFSELESDPSAVVNVLVKKKGSPWATFN